MEDPTVEENDNKKDSDNDDNNNSNPPGTPSDGNPKQGDNHKDGDQTIDDGGDVYEFRNGEWVKIGHYNQFLGVTPVNPSTGTMPDVPMDFPSLIPIG